MFKFELEEQENVSKSSSLWCEKFRPDKLEDFVGNDDIIKSAKEWIRKGEIPQICLSGSPGVGKTSLAKLLIKNIPCDSLIINSSDENSVDHMRNKVQDFAMTMGTQKLKIILLDEFERNSLEAQCLLRNLCETYSDSTRFILTTNYKEKVLDAIRSRCQMFDIVPPSKVDAMKHLVKILTIEKIVYKNEDVAFIIESFFPDLRKILNFAQQSSITGELIITKTNSVDHDYKIKLVELLKTSPNNSKAFNECRQLLSDASFSNYEELYKYLFSKVDDYANGHEAGVILILADTVYQNALVFEREIGCCSCMHKIINAIK